MATAAAVATVAAVRQLAQQVAIAYDGRTYEVMAPGGEPVWRWSDPYHQVYRIHTKCITEE